jgi:hypothetical protein
MSKEKREREWTLMQEPALARALRHFERVKSGSHIDKVLSLLIILLQVWSVARKCAFNPLKIRFRL